MVETGGRERLVQNGAKEHNFDPDFDFWSSLKVWCLQSPNLPNALCVQFFPMSSTTEKTLSREPLKSSSQIFPMNPVKEQMTNELNEPIVH